MRRCYVFVLLPLLWGCGREEPPNPPGEADTVTSTAMATDPQARVIRPEFPEINAMQWDDLLLYTLKHRLPVKGYLQDVRTGLAQENGLQRLERVNSVVEGNWGEYRGVVLERILQEVEGLEGDYVQKSLKGAQLNRDFLAGTQESLAAHQLAWAALLNERLYMSALDLALETLCAVPGTREATWLAQNLRLEFANCEDLVNGILARHNALVGVAHPSYLALPAGVTPLGDGAFLEDAQFEQEYLLNLPLPRSREDVLGRLKTGKDLAVWKRLRLLQDGMEQFYQTRAHVRDAGDRLLAYSRDSRAQLLRIKNRLQEGLE